MMGDQAADAYATATTGEPDPFEQARELLAEAYLHHALAWAHVARSHDASTGALLQARVLLKLEEPGRGGGSPPIRRQRMLTAGLLPQILTVYQDLLRAQPDEPWRYEEYASALERAGQIPAAIAAYDQAIALAPQEASHHFNKGWFLLAHSQFREASSECLEAKQLGLTMSSARECCALPSLGPTTPKPPANTSPPRSLRQANALPPLQGPVPSMGR